MSAPDAGGNAGGGAWWWVALVLPIAIVGLLLVAALSVFGLRGGRPSGSTEDALPSVTVPATVDRPATVDGPASVVGSAAVVDAVVMVDADHSGLRPPPALAGVGAGDVVEVRGRGFAGHAEGVIAQCDSVGERQCRNLFPVRTDENGGVRALYRLTTTPPGTALVVEVDLDRGASVVGPGARPVIRLAGDTVVVSGAVAGTDLALLLCGEHADAATDCREGPSVTVASDGTARADVGDPRRGERVVVTDVSGTALAEPLVLVATATTAREVDLDGRRVAAGLLVALLLVGVAAQLIRSTDWRGPAEAEVPMFPEAS